MIRLFITVEDITAVMAAGYTVIRVYTDTSESGNFTTLDGTITLVAATESYEYTDTDGTSATWYKTAYYGATPGVSSKSSARKGETRRAYATVKELRDQIGKVGATTDVELAALLDAAGMAIDNFCGRPDGFMAVPTASARTYSGNGGPIQRIDECVEVTKVEVKDSPTDTDYDEWDDADWIAFAGDPQSPDFQPTSSSRPYRAIMVSAEGDYDHFTSGSYAHRRGFRPEQTVYRGVPTVRVTARWGYADTVPYVIRQACITQASRWFKRGESAWSDAVGSPDTGQLFYRKVIDPDLEFMLVDGRLVKPTVG